jgi:hypothetical protein
MKGEPSLLEKISMRVVSPVSRRHSCNLRFTLILAIALFAISAGGCATDTTNPTAPLIAGLSGTEANPQDETAIVVTNSAELGAALVPENAGRRIRVRAGDYPLTQLLTVPDGVTLEGEGVMLFDGVGMPTGFAAGTRTTLIMTTNVAGNVLTLGNGVMVRGMAIEDLAGRAGNSIGVPSRDVGDRVFTTLAEVEIVNPNSHSIVPAGPAGCGVAVVTLNPNMGADPPPHAGPELGARISSSIIRSNATGTGCGLFAFNFAPVARVSVALDGNVVVGGIIVSGGVSRPDAVHDSRTEIQSKRNLYRNGSADQCAPQRIGWNVNGGSGTPAPLPTAATERNSVRIHSFDDRIEGFTTAMLAVGGRRFFAAPIAGPTTDNSVDLQLLGTTIATPSCGAATAVADFRLAGALVSGASLVPGDGNTLRALMRGVTGSGSRSNVYADVLGPTGPLAPLFQGTGNRLEIAGNLHAFEQTNRGIDPAPGSEFFTGGQ